ncbi:sulfatase [Maribellus sediminis]|uniref:sulfatase family protein n=1 Tax=Maribellus sediminis TaxID=2696285 RepID=UPI001431CCB6|nr:sulfatase [Maribellus sediminis]
MNTKLIEALKSALFVCATILLFSACNTKEEPKEQPNILFILSDDHTSQAWGIYGGILKDVVHTPNISRLAEEGVVLDNCFCTNSICTPSRATILTGQYSHHNGVYTLADALYPDSMNIAKVLHENGYQTAIVGKWHLKKQPAGFDYFNVLPGQGRYWNPILKTKENWEDGYGGGKEYEGFSTDVIADLSIDWMKNRDKTKPFMMMCHFKATHEPYDFPDRFKHLLDSVEIPEPASLFDAGPETTGRTFKGQVLENLRDRFLANTRDSTYWAQYPELPFSVDGLDAKEQRRKTYHKLVKDFIRSGAAIDDNIGKLLDFLEAEGIADNTVVIYTADQGYFLGEHGFFDKRLIYEESLRMPFVIRYPKEFNGGKRINDIILNIDFAALLADFAGVKKPDFVEGNSFRANLKGETPDNWRHSMYYRYWLHLVDRPAHFGIRNQRYKLAFFYGQPLEKEGTQKETTEPAWEFYDLQKDPKELHNAYGEAEYAAIIAEMKTELIRLRNENGDTDKDYPVMQDLISTHWND